MNINYDKAELQKGLDLLIGNKITDVYYYTEYEDVVFFDQIPEIEGIPILGFLLETDLSGLFSISDIDSSPNFDLGGIQVLSLGASFSPGEKPSQINRSKWDRYKNRRIVSTAIFDIKHSYFDDEVIVPYGIRIDFEGNEVLYIVNAYIENYVDNENNYSLINGQSLVLFFTEEVFAEYKLIG